MLVIDEISMVRSDLLDAIDAVLRRYRHHDRPFGGVQLLMIGDLQQLTPVVTPADEELLRPYYDALFLWQPCAATNALCHPTAAKGLPTAGFGFLGHPQPFARQSVDAA